MMFMLSKTYWTSASLLVLMSSWIRDICSEMRLIRWSHLLIGFSSSSSSNHLDRCGCENGESANGDCANGVSSVSACSERRKDAREGVDCTENPPTLDVGDEAPLALLERRLVDGLSLRCLVPECLRTSGSKKEPLDPR